MSEAGSGTTWRARSASERCVRAWARPNGEVDTHRRVHPGARRLGPFDHLDRRCRTVRELELGQQGVDVAGRCTLLLGLATSIFRGTLLVLSLGFHGALAGLGRLVLLTLVTAATHRPIPNGRREPREPREPKRKEIPISLRPPQKKFFFRFSTSGSLQRVYRCSCCCCHGRRFVPARLSRCGVRWALDRRGPAAPQHAARPLGLGGGPLCADGR